MHTQVINRILETEKQASRLVDSSRIQAEKIVSDARDKANKDYFAALEHVRDSFQKDYSARESELDAKLNELEHQQVSSGVDGEVVRKISKKIVDFISNTVIE